MPSKTISAVFLNTWAHRRAYELNQLVREYRQKCVSVMCFTEVTDSLIPHEDAGVVYSATERQEPPALVNGFSALKQCLGTDYVLLYDTADRTTWDCARTGFSYPEVGFGSALAIHKRYEIIAQGNEFIETNGVCQPRVIQWVIITNRQRYVLIAHLHGVWLKHNTKGDDEVRFYQSEVVNSLVSRLRLTYGIDDVILGGDLNLALETEAIAMLEHGKCPEHLMRNLVREFGIQSTRTPLFRLYDTPGVPQHADYVLVSPAVKVHDFHIANDSLASDHAPLYVEIE